jgi:hypothetical protein
MSPFKSPMERIPSVALPNPRSSAWKSANETTLSRSTSPASGTAAVKIPCPPSVNVVSNTTTPLSLNGPFCVSCPLPGWPRFTPEMVRNSPGLISIEPPSRATRISPCSGS